MYVACAEGSALSLFSYDKLKSPKKKAKIPATSLIRFITLIAMPAISLGPQNHPFTRETQDIPVNVPLFTGTISE